MLSVYLVFDRRAVLPALTNYWRDHFPPTDRGPDGFFEWLTRLARPLEPLVGLGGNRWLMLVLVAGGLVTLGALRRTAVALAIVLVAATAVALGAVHAYPLLDQRTSHYLYTLAAVTIAIGAAGVCAGLSLLAAVRSRSRLVGPLAASLALGVTVWYAQANSAYVRIQSPFPDVVRSQAAYVGKHRSPGDVILVPYYANWNFGYYWSQDPPLFRPLPPAAVGFGVTYDPHANIIVCEDRTAAVFRSCLHEALDRARSGGENARLWLVGSQLRPYERAAFDAVLSELAITPVREGAGVFLPVTPGHRAGSSPPGATGNLTR